MNSFHSFASRRTHIVCTHSLFAHTHTHTHTYPYLKQAAACVSIKRAPVNNAVLKVAARSELQGEQVEGSPPPQPPPTHPSMHQLHQTQSHAKSHSQLHQPYS